jgi:hypothetical protein
VTTAIIKGRTPGCEPAVLFAKTTKTHFKWHGGVVATAGLFCCCDFEKNNNNNNKRQRMDSMRRFVVGVADGGLFLLSSLSSSEKQKMANSKCYYCWCRYCPD